MGLNRLIGQTNAEKTNVGQTTEPSKQHTKGFFDTISEFLHRLVYRLPGSQSQPRARAVHVQKAL